MSTQHSQLPLSLGLKDSATFASFYPGPNGEILTHLRGLTGTPWQPGVYLWGERGTGKSHLLQAVCRDAGERDLAAVYLPLGSAERFPREALQGLEHVDVVCIDDIQAVAGDQDWEAAIIHLFERIHALGGVLVVTGNALPAGLGLQLPPLASRLTWGLQFQLQALGAADKLAALQLRATRRGFELSPEAGRYLVRHSGQDMHLLFNALDSLDRASLAAKRKLTIPFIRAVLKDADAAGTS